MKEKVSVVEIIVVIIIVAVLALVIGGAIINESNKISSGSLSAVENGKKSQSMAAGEKHITAARCAARNGI